MTKKVELTVNDVPINLDYFVEGYVESVTAGILASLKDTGEIKDLELDIDNEGQVQIKKRSFFMGLKIPDVTAPALISSGNRLALWRQASRATGSTHVHK